MGLGVVGIKVSEELFNLPVLLVFDILEHWAFFSLDAFILLSAKYMLADEEQIVSMHDGWGFKSPPMIQVLQTKGIRITLDINIPC